MWWSKKEEKCQKDKGQDEIPFRDSCKKKSLMIAIKEIVQDLQVKEKYSDRSTLAESRQMYAQSISSGRQMRNSVIFHAENDIQSIINRLKKGFRMLKHSENTKQPHDKFVYISQDAQSLCWKSPTKNDEKKILLKNITSLTIGKIGKGLQKQLGVSTFNLKKCVVISSSQRALELQAGSEEVIQSFVDDLKAVMNNSFKFRFSENVLK